MLANGIAAAYSLGQAVRCVVSMVRGNVLFSKPLAWIIFSADQVQIICCNLPRSVFSINIHLYVIVPKL